jgi:hypothetical protein
MATPLLGLALPVNGATSWGDTVNNSVTSLLDSAVAGTTTLSTDADVTLSSTIEASNQAREAVILWTASGSTTRYITAPAQSKTYVVINSSSTQAIVLRGVGPTTGVTINAGERIVAAWNGSDFAVVNGYLNIPQNSQSTNYTTVLGDAGKHIYHPTTDANTRTYTIDGSVSYAIGAVIMFVNMSSQSITIALSSGTMYLANLGSTGSRTLGQYGVANALKITSNTWIITGTVLT